MCLAVRVGSVTCVGTFLAGAASVCGGSVRCRVSVCGGLVCVCVCVFVCVCLCVFANDSGVIYRCLFCVFTVVSMATEGITKLPADVTHYLIPDFEVCIIM